MLGAGWRGGYDKGLSYGMYAKNKGVTEQQYEDWTNLAIQLILAQEEVIRNKVALRLEGRASIINGSDLPHLLDTWATNFLITKMYSVGMHYDSDVSEAYAWGSWHEKHAPECKNKGSCWQGWFFVLPEYRIAIRLHHNTFICWDSPNVLHGTILDGQYHKGCNSVPYSAITQVKRSFVQRVLSAQRKQNK